MQLTTKAIVLSAIKYGDTSLIVKCLTQSSGVKSYLLKGVLKSKKGALKAAYFQPLMLLEMVVNHKDKGTLEHIKEVKVYYPYQTLQLDIKKNTIALFLSEVLSHALQEEETNQLLFQYIEAALQWLDTHDEVVNFHLLFLLHLTKYLGFFPDTYAIDAEYFDLREGEFTNKLGFNPVIRDENLVLFKALLGTNFDAIHTVKLNKQQRQEMLQELVVYYELHLQGFKKPKSLEILNAVFR